MLPVASVVTKRVNAETFAWLGVASDEDIARALDFGRAAAIEFALRLSAASVNVAPERCAVTIGQVGEAQIERALAAKFKVTNTAHTAKSGDMSLFVEHRKVIVEVKNYTSNVPSSQVEKFQRDIATAGATAGVFVSLRTPIATVTDSFVIRYEQVENTSIPCAYIVSDNDAAAVLAVDMVTQLARAAAHVSSDLYDRDRILGGIHTISAHCDELAKSRTTLHEGIGDILTQMFKLTSGLATGEAAIRERVNEIKQELFHATFTGGMPCLESHKWYANYTTGTKKFISDVVAFVDTGEIGSWRVSGNRCMHISGVGFVMFAKHVDVIMPRERAAGLSTAKILSIEMSTVKTNIIVTLSDASISIVLGMLA